MRGMGVVEFALGVLRRDEIGRGLGENHLRGAGGIYSLCGRILRQPLGLGVVVFGIHDVSIFPSGWLLAPLGLSHPISAVREHIRSKARGGQKKVPLHGD